jgi:peptidyl-prolyl cis-trans isomerase SurA
MSCIHNQYPKTMRLLFAIAACLLWFAPVVLAQGDTLLIVGNQSITLPEFERVYRKNNHIQGIEQKSPAEYLNLYINFRLKVYEARQQGYDTTSAFLKELAGYREQLARPYLMDRDFVDSLVKEAYDRTVNELNVSHIMIKLSSKPLPSDTLKAYEAIYHIYRRLLQGESFENIARSESEDPSARVNEGRLGWFSAFAMVLPFENAAYTLHEGEVSAPIRTRFGYHIVRLNAKRQAMGEIKLSHIMIRTEQGDMPKKSEHARLKIDSCYTLLQSGVPFETVAKNHSEDAGSARSGGRLRWIRSGELPPNLESVVFSITDSGSYTTPVQSDYGWHIFRMEGKRDIESFEQMKDKLETRILADERGRLAEEAFLRTIKHESGFVSYPQNVDALAGAMDSSVYSGLWQPAALNAWVDPVCSFGNRVFTQKNLADYISQTKQYNKNEDLKQIARMKYQEMVKKELFSFANQQLESKYPEFRNLMEEYHDGILLFNIMEDMVWNKAVKDTAGLEAYYNQHSHDYRWPKRAEVSVYTLHQGDYLKRTRQLARKRKQLNLSASEMVRQVCGNDSVQCIDVEDRLIEEGGASPYGAFAWKVGAQKVLIQNKLTRLLCVNAILAPCLKTLQEARGEVASDYQDFIDQQWIANLKSRYPVVVNEKVLKQIIP